MKPLRIVHLGTTVSRGGAAAAMCRLHEGLLKRGANSAVVALESSEPSPDSHVVTSPRLKAQSELIRFAEEFYSPRTPISNTHFSLDLAVSARLEEQPVIESADVIHLHWVAGFLSSQSLMALAALGKPLFWTLHDLRPITGGCHFPAGCRKFVDRCVDCPQLEFDPLRVTERAQEALRLAAAFAKIHYIAPSSWIQECARASTVAANHTVTRVPNGLDGDLFRPIDKKNARQKFGLQADTFYLLLGAQSFDEARKGIRAAKEILRRLARLPGLESRIRDGAIRLACFGQSSENLKVEGWQIDRFGYLDNEQALCAAYSGCDLLLFTSQEDNLPGVVMEAMACSLPVAAFSVGGVPDLVIEGKTGLLLDPGDHPGCASRLAELLSQPAPLASWAKMSRSHILENFTVDRHAGAMIDLYNQARPEGPPSASPDAEPTHSDVFLDFEAPLQLATENARNKIKTMETGFHRLRQYVRKCRRAPWTLFTRRPPG